MKKSLLVPVALSLALIAACSSSAAPQTPTVTSADAGTADAAKATTDAAVAADTGVVVDAARLDSGVDTGVVVGECSSSATKTTCTECCATKHPDGAGVYIVTLIDCLCVPTRCKTQCATTFCADPPKDPDAACNTCIGAKQGECIATVVATCMADPECVAWDKCMGDSGCTGKP